MLNETSGSASVSVHLAYSSVEERQRILDQVLTMESFSNHLGHPKQSNWFARNKAVHEQIGEYHAGKMVYESQLTDEKDPDEVGTFKIRTNVDPRKELQKILRDGGGLRLAYRLMQDALYVHVCIMYGVEHACWDYYTSEIESVKTPEDNLRSTWRLSRIWAAHPHLWQTHYRRHLFRERHLSILQTPN